MSLPVGIMICAILAAAILRPWQRRAMAGLALLFFAFLYTDEGALNDFEDQLDETVAQLPQGHRVVLSVDAPGLQVNALTHMIDRACIGRCWSYANYEPSSGQFRIRVAGPTSIVAPTDLESGLLQLGLYKVKASDPPLVQIVAGNSGRLVVRTPPVGQFIGMTGWHGL